jgi:hypothetical protein
MRLAALLLCSSLSLPAGTCYLTVSGLGGEPDYEQRFVSLAKTVDKILRESSGEARVETLYGPAATATCPCCAGAFRGTAGPMTRWSSC